MFRLGRELTEDEMDDYRRQDAEEKMRRRLEEMGRRGGPDACEPCEDCGGTGWIDCTHDQGCCQPGRCPGWECYRCLGSGVQP